MEGITAKNEFFFIKIKKKQDSWSKISQYGGHPY